MTIHRQLSNHEELVHALDPDPVFDYLVQHGVLEQEVVDTICGEEKLVDRNIKLLKHLEDTGNPAVELFLNALRQSGQLHLASLLDVEHRIKPIYGEGYWEKQRYKGQVTITFQLVAAKVRVRKDSDEDKSPKIEDINAMLTPFKVKHSYENVAPVVEDQPRARKALEYSNDSEDEKSCWCCLPFCCSSKSRKKQKRLKQNVEISISKTQNGADIMSSPVTKPPVSLDFCDIMVSLPSQPASPLKSGSTFFKSRPSPMSSPSESDTPSSIKSDALNRSSNHQLSEIVQPDVCRLSKSEGDLLDTEVTFDTNTEKVSVTPSRPSKQEKSKKTKKSGRKKTNKETKKQKNNKSTSSKLETGGVGNMTNDVENKENSDPCIYSLKDRDVTSMPCGELKMESRTPSFKKSPPTSLNTKKTSAMKRSATYELVERWKTEGAQYERTRDHFFSFFDNAIQSSIVRYFEQTRKTLVLSVRTKESMSLCTLCMTIKEVRKLREDYELGALHEDLVRCIVPQNVVDRMECCAIHLRTVIDEDDFLLSYQELS